MSLPAPSANDDHGLTLPAALTRALDQVRRRHLLLRLAEFPILATGALSSAWLLQGVADRLLDLSWQARCILLLLDVLLVAWLARCLIIIPWRKRLNRRSAALLVEKAMPDFDSALISAVDLSANPATCPPESRLLAKQLITDTMAKIGDADLSQEVVRPERVMSRLKWVSVPVLGALLVFAMTNPTSGLALKRILLSKLAYPARTQVLAITGDLEVDAGGALGLQARASGLLPNSGTLVITRDGKEPERIPLSPVNAATGDFARQIANIREPFRYRFELNDGVSPEHRVAVRFPPTIAELRFTQVYPGYTGMPEAELPPTALRLLDGATLRIAGTASKPLRSGSLKWNGGEEVPVHTRGDSFEADFVVPSSGLKSFAIHLESDDGNRSVDPPSYRVEIIHDKPPVVTLTKPVEESLSVVMNAKIPVAFEASDDFGLGPLSLAYRISRPLADGRLQDSETGSIALEGEGKRAWKNSFEWNLARLAPPLPTGGSIDFWIEALDGNTLSGPATTRSAARTVRIVSEEQKRLELLELLAAKAAQLEQLYQQQRNLNQEIEGSIR